MYSDPMESISVTEFKAHCLEIVNRVSQTGEPIILTKRGKPSVMVSLPPNTESKGWVLGQFRDQVTIIGDLVAPLDEPWDQDLRSS